MSGKRLFMMGLMATLFGTGYALGSADGPGLITKAEASPAPPVQATRVFELRTYTTPEGKLDALVARFRDHTRGLFEKHGMTNVGYWIPQNPELRQNTLIYVLAHPSREAANQAWRNFAADPEWLRLAEETERDGPLWSNIVRQYLDPTDFSQLR